MKNEMRNIKLTMAYDGTAYAGWQIQPDHPTVQEKLQQAITSLTGDTINVIAAGRTDSGVHALGQVANFLTESRIPTERWVPALNGELPRDIVIRHADEVDADFHATYSAKNKTYRYIIHTGLTRDPFANRYSHHVPQSLDLSAMKGGAVHLVGKHDFRCFETDFPNRATSVRTVTELRLLRLASIPCWNDDALSADASVNSSGDFICIEITADGFLYNMVRAIAGTLLQVGLGRWSADAVREILNNGDRAQAGPTAPPQGLFLVRVVYD